MLIIFSFIIVISLFFIFYSIAISKMVKKYNEPIVYLNEIINLINYRTEKFDFIIKNKGRIKIKFEKDTIIYTIDFIYNPTFIQVTLRYDLPLKQVIVKKLPYDLVAINNYIISLDVI